MNRTCDPLIKSQKEVVFFTINISARLTGGYDAIT